MVLNVVLCVLLHYEYTKTFAEMAIKSTQLNSKNHAKSRNNPSVQNTLTGCVLLTLYLMKNAVSTA